MNRARRAAPWLAALALWVLAAWLRVRGTAMATVLSDQVGPWWVAASGPPWSEPHAPPFGWGLYLPYWMLLGPADSLWTAVQGLLLVHALMAPLALGAGWLLARHEGCIGGALLAGAAVALDPALIDTALSGSKTYLAGAWIGALSLGICARDRAWGPPLALAALALAAMNHPLALCAAPLLVCLPWREKRTRWAAGLGLLLLAPRLYWVATHELPNTGDLSGPVGLALEQLWQTAPWTLLLASGGVVAGLSRSSSRSLSLAVLSSWLLLISAGAYLGYLRDYHLRMLLLPSIVGWAALPRGWSLVGLLMIRLPSHPIGQASHAVRPGNLGLTHQFSKSLQALEDPVIVVDGAWLSSASAAEPSALTLDLWLRGRPADSFGPDGTVVVIVSAERGQGQELGDIDEALKAWAGEPLMRGDRYFLAAGSPEEWQAWSARICESRMADGRGEPRFGGAWDGLIVLQPELRSEDLEVWWDCP